MYEITKIVEIILEVYNNFFMGIILATIIALIIIAFNLKKQRDNDENKKWYSYITVIKNEIVQMIVQIIIFVFLIILLKESFYIDILYLFQFNKYWKIFFTLWIVFHLKSAKSLYSRLEFHDFIDNVIDGKYSYTSPENIYLNSIDEYQMNYELEFEKLGILKSIAPVSLIPLIAGYVLEGKNIIVNWNWYTVAIFIILFIYIYKLWKTYKYLKIWKWKKLQIHKKLRLLQHKSVVNKKDEV